MPTAPVSLMPALRRVIAGRDRPDADLVAAFVSDRDPEAFAALVRRHGPMVLGVCRRVVRDPDAADDAFQAVFLVLARRAADVRPANRVGAWLYGVAYRTALKARAVRARRRTWESQVDAMPEPAAPPAADGWDELKPVLDEELARLPDRLRVPVVLCDLEGRPQRAVAGQLGIAPATLAGRLADARKALAARLTRRGVTLSAAALAALLAERASAGVVHPQLAAGVVRAAEAVAAGGAAAGLVSANALQLCDGVMRMIFLTKLKAAAATAAVLLAVAGAVGPGPRPATAADDTGAKPAAPARVADADAAFLDRVCVEFRGSKGTAVEHGYFAADTDAGKRKKVTRWLLDGPAAAEAPATALTFTADVNRLLSLGTDGIARVWDAPDDLTSRFLNLSNNQIVEVLDRLDAPKAEPAKRVEVALDKLAAVPVAGEPVRVKVVVATDDGKGGVKYRTEERLVVPGKALDGKESQPKATLLYRFLDSTKPATGTGATKVEGARVVNEVVVRESDAAFLKRAVTEARGTPPTALEERYFAADADPKKREKLLDALLADPAALRRVGDGWKRRMLTPPTPPSPARVERFELNEKNFDLIPRSNLKVVPYVAPPTTPKADFTPYLFVQPKTVTPPPPMPKAVPPSTPAVPLVRVVGMRPTDKWGRLVDELLAAGKTDDQMLESLSLAAAGRLPTDIERRLSQAVLPTGADRAAGWKAVARALAGPTPPSPR